MKLLKLIPGLILKPIILNSGCGSGSKISREYFILSGDKSHRINYTSGCGLQCEAAQPNAHKTLQPSEGGNVPKSNIGQGKPVSKLDSRGC